MVGLLLAVGIATLLAIVLSAGYALVVRELRQINANLEQLIELGAVARRHDEPLRGSPHQDIGWNTQNTIADFQYRGNRRHGILTSNNVAI